MDRRRHSSVNNLLRADGDPPNFQYYGPASASGPRAQSADDSMAAFMEWKAQEMALERAESLGGVRGTPLLRGSADVPRWESAPGPGAVVPSRRPIGAMDRIDVLNAAAGYSNELTTRQARLLDARGRFALNGRDYSQRFYGNQHAVTSSARVAAAKATQARLARVGMTLAKMTPIVSVGLGSYNLLAGGASNRAIVEMASSFAFTGVGVLGPKGAAISLGLTITNASGGFDGFYSRFDHTPRFNLRLFGRDPEGESP